MRSCMHLNSSDLDFGNLDDSSIALLIVRTSERSEVKLPLTAAEYS